MQTHNIIKSTVDQLLSDVADFLVKQDGLFAKKMTKTALMKLMSGASTTTSKKEESDDDEKDDETNVPEGWTEKDWKALEKKRAALKDGELLNISSSRVLTSAKPKGVKSCVSKSLVSIMIRGFSF